MSYEASLSFAQQLDEADPLREFRARFHLPQQANGQPYLYFCGNSLGLQPKTVKTYLERELEDWAMLGVEGHFHARNPWMPYHEYLTKAMAEVVGAEEKEVVVMNGLTVNLHLMMVSFYRPTASRYKIVVEADAFPSDLYAVSSQLAFHGYDPGEALIKLKPRPGEHRLRTEDIETVLAAEGHQVALVLLGGVNYYTGQFFELERITQAGHRAGAIVGVDLAHAAGNVPLQLHEWGVDFACWCSYKYLNSGPGGVSGCFVHARHVTRTDLPRLAGWWGHEKETRFEMGPDFVPIPTAEGWQLSNAPVLSMAALWASLEIFAEAGMPAIRKKSIKLTGFLEFLLQHTPNLPSLEIITPNEPAQRGAQLSLLTGPGGKHIFDRLTANGVICDWREPNVIRIAPAPLYNTFEEGWLLVQALRGV